jgi:Transposase DDE domain
VTPRTPRKPAACEATAERFTINEVSGDKAYLSRDYIDAVFECGETPYIQFKGNRTGGVGALFQKMFHDYAANREVYLAHYHKRSNVESTFSMVKAKFGDSVRSKLDVAMKNEVLCKLLCHNICVVHQSHVELGIEPVFWGGNKLSATIPSTEPCCTGRYPRVA